MKNREIAAIFNEIAYYLEIRDDNPFKIRAYRKAALNIENLSAPIEQLAEQNQLEKIPGIGKDLALKVREFLTTGSVGHLEELKHDTPPGLLALLDIQGIGPKTARHLYETFGIESIEDLEKLAREHKLAGLPGMKEKTEENILKGIEFLKQGKDRFPLGVALPLAEEVVDYLKKLHGKAPSGNGERHRYPGDRRPAETGDECLCRHVPRKASPLPWHNPLISHSQQRPSDGPPGS